MSQVLTETVTTAVAELTEQLQRALIRCEQKIARTEEELARLHSLRVELEAGLHQLAEVR